MTRSISAEQSVNDDIVEQLPTLGGRIEVEVWAEGGFATIV